MKKLLKPISFGLVIFLLSCTTPAPMESRGPQDQRETQTHMEMSFEDLAQVGHTLMSAFDKIENTCSLPDAKVFFMPQTYRALVDERYSEEQEIYLKKSLKEKVRYWSVSCEASCSCDVYVGFSEYLQAFNFQLSSTERLAIDKLKPKAILSREKVSACLKQAPWVCRSQVLKEISKRTGN
jgi:hypothetical protein